MTRSANEVQNLIAKAARGAGAPPAQAAAFGRAAVCHLSAGRGEAELRRALGALPQGPIMELPLALARLMETAETGNATGDLSHAQTPQLVQSYVDALPFKHQAQALGGGITVQIDVTQPAPRAAVTRLDPSAAFVAELTALLAKTLVPDTAASRLSGAGAGLQDND